MNRRDSSGKAGSGSIERQLGRRGVFAAVLREAASYIELNRRVREAVPASARGEIGIARITGDCVEIAAATPARATQARLAADDILAAARAHWPAELRSTRIIVVPGVRFAEPVADPATDPG